jgi:hypothetical protein
VSEGDDFWFSSSELEALAVSEEMFHLATLSWASNLVFGVERVFRCHRSWSRRRATYACLVAILGHPSVVLLSRTVDLLEINDL